MSKTGKKRLLVVFNIGIAMIISYSSAILFHRYIIGSYASDFPTHIQTVKMGRAGYSLAHRFIAFCLLFPHGEKVLAILLGGVVLGTSIGMWFYIHKHLNEYLCKESGMLLAMALLFVNNIYLPKVNEHLYYYNTNVSQPWHNITFILMKFLGAFVICLYFEIYQELKENRLSLNKGIVFVILLSLCNFAKPNFFLAFAPAVFLALVILFINDKGENWKTLIIFGCLVLLSIPVLLYQVGVVYDVNENSSIGFELENFRQYVFAPKGSVFIYEFSNLAFPLFVAAVLLLLKFVKHEKIELDRMGQAFLMFFIAHMQQLLMVDEGPRKYYGNYAWGVFAFGMYLFMVCIVEWILAYKKKRLKSRLIFIIGNILFCVHIFCGITYFVLMCCGYYFLI